MIKGMVEEPINDDITIVSDPRNAMFQIKRNDGGRVYAECSGMYTSVTLARQAYENAKRRAKDKTPVAPKEIKSK